MKKKIIIIVVLIVSNFYVSCGGGGDDTPSPSPEPTPIPKPGAVTLVAPSNGAVCVDGVFTWNSTKDATSYVLTVFNKDGTVYATNPTSSTTKTISNLTKSKALTWQVTAKNNSGESVSSKWSASTPGEAIVNYIPTVTVEFDIAADTVKLVANDADGDSLTYDFYSSSDNDFTVDERLITNEAITINQGEVISNIGFVVGQTLWVKVVVRDLNNNESATIKSYDGK